MGMHGEGTYRWGDGRVCSGQWHRNYMGPRGVMQWTDGRRYEGEFLNGKKHGVGIQSRSTNPYTFKALLSKYQLGWNPPKWEKLAILKIMSVSYNHRASHFLHLYVVNYIIGLDDTMSQSCPTCLERHAQLIGFLT